MKTRSIDTVFAVAFSVIAFVAAIAWIVTSDDRFGALNLGALTLSLLYRICAYLDALTGTEEEPSP